MQNNYKKHWLLGDLKEAKGSLFEALLVSLFTTLLALAVPVFILQVYDRVVFQGGIETLKGLAIGMAVTILMDMILRKSRSRLFQAVGVVLDVRVGQRIFEKFSSLPLNVLEGRPSSHWLAVFRDQDVVRNTISGASGAMLMDLPFVFIFAFVVWMLAPQLIIVVAIVAPVFMLLAWFSAYVSSKALEREQAASRDKDGLLSEFIQGRETVKALDMAKWFRGRWDDRLSEAVQSSIHRGGSTDTHQVLAHGLTMATTIGMTTVGALLIVEQQMTIGALIASNMLARRLISPLAMVVGQWKNVSQFRQAMKRLDAFLQLPSDSEKDTVFKRNGPARASLEKVIFKYAQEEKPVVDDVSAHIGPAGLHCIVGKNGSGKTTLLKILSGLYAPESGRMMINNADIRQFSRSQVTSLIGYLPQDVTLFDGTIASNIGVSGDHSPSFKADENNDRMIEAAEMAAVHELIQDRKAGYESLVGEGGDQCLGECVSASD